MIFAALQRLRHHAGRCASDAGTPGWCSTCDDQLRLRHVGDVEDEEAVVPVADIEAVAEAQRMVAARRYPVAPGVLLAARLPLAGDPPAPDLLRLRRIGEIEDHHDVADIALGGRRDVGVAAVEIDSGARRRRRSAIR